MSFAGTAMTRSPCLIKWMPAHRIRSLRSWFDARQGYRHARSRFRRHPRLSSFRIRRNSRSSTQTVGLAVRNPSDRTLGERAEVALAQRAPLDRRRQENTSPWRFRLTGRGALLIFRPRRRADNGREECRTERAASLGTACPSAYAHRTSLIPFAVATPLALDARKM